MDVTEAVPKQSKTNLDSRLQINMIMMIHSEFSNHKFPEIHTWPAGTDKWHVCWHMDIWLIHMMSVFTWWTGIGMLDTQHSLSNQFSSTRQHSHLHVESLRETRFKLHLEVFEHGQPGTQSGPQPAPIRHEWVSSYICKEVPYIELGDPAFRPCPTSVTTLWITCISR